MAVRPYSQANTSDSWGFPNFFAPRHDLREIVLSLGARYSIIDYMALSNQAIVIRGLSVSVFQVHMFNLTVVLLD